MDMQRKIAETVMLIQAIIMEAIITAIAAVRIDVIITIAKIAIATASIMIMSPIITVMLKITLIRRAIK